MKRTVVPKKKKKKKKKEWNGKKKKKNSRALPNDSHISLWQIPGMPKRIKKKKNTNRSLSLPDTDRF